MDEQETKSEEKTERPISDADEGDKQGAAGIVDRAGINAEKLEKAAERAEAVLKGLQDLEALKRLGGETGAAPDSKPVTEEEKKKAGAIEFFKGTPLAAAIEKHG